jgi:RNA polymerase sigma-70 factor (ECF subfamily)
LHSDGELFEAWRRGDRRAGAQLFERHYDSIARFFHNKAPRDADDLIQRTFLRCVETHDRLRKPDSFRFYLFGVARNVLLEFFEEKGRRQRHEAPNFFETSIEDVAPTPSTALVRAREERVILDALRRIPLELQIVLELYYWEELSARELAEVLEVPEGTVRTRLRRAKELFQQEIGRVAESPELARSTVRDLEAWARRLREGVRSERAGN